MKKLLLGLSVTLSAICIANGQQVGASSSGNAVAQTAATSSTIVSDANVSGRLQNSLDVKKAKVGDEVLLKVNNSVKSGGKTVVEKGSTVVGHVTSVQQKAKGTAGSQIGVVFDTIQTKSGQMPINAMITSVLSANAATSAAASDDLGLSGSSSVNSSTQSSTGGSGGLLGGVTNTVGGALNTTTNAVGQVAATTSDTVRGTTSSTLSTVRGLSISQSTSANAQSGSTLALSGGNLKLEKNTTINLNVSSATRVEN